MFGEIGFEKVERQRKRGIDKEDKRYRCRGKVDFIQLSRSVLNTTSYYPFRITLTWKRGVITAEPAQKVVNIK